MSKRSTRATDDLRSEYEFDYRKSRPNRFATHLSRRTVAVILDPDVAEVFRTSESVNGLLRAVIAVVPSKHARRRKAS